MARLIYSPITSLDGYVEDHEGKFDWAAPDDEVHAVVNDLERPIGTYLYGRRMYETMVFWEAVSTGAEQPGVIRDFAEIWRSAEKIVYSRTLQTASSARTQIELSVSSTPTQFGGSRRPRDPTSPSVAPSSAARQSPRAWSTSAICSSARSSWVPANRTTAPASV